MPLFVGHTPDPHIPPPPVDVLVSAPPFVVPLPPLFAGHDRLRVVRREQFMRPVVYVATDRYGSPLLVGKSHDLMARIVRHQSECARMSAAAPTGWAFVPSPDVGPDGWPVDVDLLEEGVIRLCRPSLLRERRGGPTDGMVRAMVAAGFHV